MPPEIICERKEGFLGAQRKLQVIRDRYLVGDDGSVVDLRENKVLNTGGGYARQIDETKVTYSVYEPPHDAGEYTFEFATGKATRIGDLRKPVSPWYLKLPGFDIRCVDCLSPDGKKAIGWKDQDELVLYTETEEPKSLGRGFGMKTEPDRKLPGVDFFYFPILWFDNERFLTQRENGKLATVDLEGKVSEIATIKNVPSIQLAAFSRARDRILYLTVSSKVDSGKSRTVYHHYHIDIEKKTAEKLEWTELGHGFDASYEEDEQLGPKMRHNGKAIPRSFWSSTSRAETAPGHLAVIGKPNAERRAGSWQVLVWSSVRQEWSVALESELPQRPVGWIK
jgi:hypothetical protein